MNRIVKVLIAVLVLAGVSHRAGASIIVDHQPHNFGGPVADTLFLDSSSQQNWQLLADEVLLSTPATVRQVTWWGFYGSTFSCNINPPVGDETMRVRLYGARPLDGLPGEVLYEESFLNPLREETGRTVFVGCGPKEYKFSANLSTDLSLESNRPYWIEFVQVGAIGSYFRWEDSHGSEQNGYAFLNRFTPDWQHSVSFQGDLAFQLSSIPEPTNIGIVLTILTLFTRRRPKGRSCRK